MIKIKNLLQQNLWYTIEKKKNIIFFNTTKAYNAIKECMDFRTSFGERITGESWIFRDIWQKTCIRYSHNIGVLIIVVPFNVLKFIILLVLRNREFFKMHFWIVIINR